jgi:ABC-type multidrug transport system fused ATPase/permease subunit
VFGSGGTVAGIGRHDELLTQCDAYKQLIQRQTDKG